MSGGSRRSWQQFKESRPRNRFQERYHYRQQGSSNWFSPRKVVYIMGGIVIAVASLVLAPLPGPGWATFFIGLALLAGEILFVARFLDSIEVDLRKIALVFRDVWRVLSPLGRMFIVLVVLLLAATLVYAALRLIFGG